MKVTQITRTVSMALFCAGLAATASARTLERGTVGNLSLTAAVQDAKVTQELPPLSLSELGDTGIDDAVGAGLLDADAKDNGSGGSGGSGGGIERASNSIKWWDNGPESDGDFAHGQSSQDLNLFMSRTADDIILTDGNWYYIDTVTVRMAVKGYEHDEPHVNLEVYSDCDGKPDSLLTTHTKANSIVEATFVRDSTRWPEFEIWDITYKIDDFLPGYVRYWLSPVGQGLGYYFWLGSNNGTIQGVQGQFKSDQYGKFEWTDVFDCPCDSVCTDFYLCIDGLCCELLKDNSEFDLTLPPLLTIMFPNTQVDGARSADNFQVPPREPVQICRLEAWFATNCPFIEGELYPNICDEPDVSGDPISLGEPERYDTGQTVLGLPVYKLVWTDTGVVLNPGVNYWLSIYGIGTGSINDRAYWLFHADEECDKICITEGQYRNQFDGIDDFTPVSEVAADQTARDFAFRLWTAAVGTSASNNDTAENQGGVENDVTTDGETTDFARGNGALGL